MEPRSVITFYRLDTQAENINWREASRFVDQHYGGKAICANLGHFDLEPDELAKSAQVWLLNDPNFRRDLERESSGGANYFFVAPVVGKPVWGHAC